MHYPHWKTSENEVGFYENLLFGASGIMNYDCLRQTKMFGHPCSSRHGHVDKCFCGKDRPISKSDISVHCCLLAKEGGSNREVNLYKRIGHT